MMNRTQVEHILELLNSSTDKRVIHRALVKLRTDIVKNAAGIELFRDCGGMKPLVRFLNKPHEQILEVALSILANCCVNNLCCKQALEFKVYIPLASILKSIPNPVIQLRACRLLGNLGKYDNQLLLATHCPAIAICLCQILLDTSDVNIRIMALRAARSLMGNAEFLRNFLQSNGLVTLLHLLTSVMRKENPTEQSETTAAARGLKRNQHREQYFEEVARHLEGVRSDIFDREILKNISRSYASYAMPEESKAAELVTDIMKCLQVMSDLKIQGFAWESASRNNCTFHPIVSFLTGESTGRSMALKILSNFSKTPGAVKFVSAANAIVAACDLLVSPNLEQPLSDSETRHCINIACMLCSDACNRAKIRYSGAIRKLIAMVKVSESNTEISSILFLLNHFEYDNMSMELMIEEGLISILVKQLNIFLSSEDEYHKRKRRERQQQSAKKRKAIDDVSADNNKKFAWCAKEPIVFDLESPSNSPKYNMTSTTPCSSRSMSPVGKEYDTADPISDDERYSPACSDDEDDDDPNKGTRGEANNLSTPPNAPAENVVATESSDIMKLLDIACRSETIEDNVLDKDDDDFSQGGQDSKVHLPSSSIDFIENLLFRATLMTSKSRELGKSETMHTLVKAINTFGCDNYFSTTLTNILLESQFFAMVVKHGIVHEIYQITKIKEMQKEAFGLLETLTCVGESDYGKAELARMLNSDIADDKIRASIAVAYIIKNRNLLYQFLKNGCALNQLLDIIMGNNYHCANETVEAFTSMMTYTLHINVPQVQGLVAGSLEEFSENDALLSDSQSDMRFIVHEKAALLPVVGESDTAISKTTPQTVVTVGFNKKLLCDISDVFNTMLNSDFREGNDGEIHLSSCSPAGLKYFLNLVVRQSLKKPANYPQSNQYSSLLEAFELSRVYIIPQMEQSLQEMLTDLLDETNCLSLFEWSVRNYHAELTDMAINYYLCSTISTERKIQLFRKANESTFSKQWLEMMVNSIYVQCSNGY